MIRRILLIVTITAAALLSAGPRAREHCDRACLQGFVDSYLDAMAKHDPSKLPVANVGKFTENGKAAEVGRGFLEDSGGEHLSALRSRYQKAGDAAAQAVVAENGELDTFFVRLKLKGQENHRSGNSGLPQGRGRIFRAGKDDRRRPRCTANRCPNPSGRCARSSLTMPAPISPPFKRKEPRIIIPRRWRRR